MPIVHTGVRRGRALPDATPEVLEFLGCDFNRDVPICQLDAYLADILQDEGYGAVELVGNVLGALNELLGNL